MVREVKLIYEDISVGAKENFDYSFDNIDDRSKASDLKLETYDLINFGTISEKNQTFLDGKQEFVREDMSDVYTGIWSNVLSDSEGKINSNEGLILSISTETGNYISQGFTIIFDEYTNTFPKNINIKWYRGETLLDDKSFTNNSYSCLISNMVENFNKVIFNFNDLNMPYNKLKITDLIFGTKRTYTNSELISMEVTEEIDEISNEVSINTIDFKLITNDGISLLFQAKQPLKLYIDNELVGHFFVDEGERTASNKYEVSGEDYIGMMDRVYFYGGIYTNKNVEELLIEIFNKAKVPYILDIETYDIETLTGYIQYCTCREALQQVLFASGLVCDTSFNDSVRVFKIDTTNKSTYTEDKLISGQTTKTSNVITEVRLTEHFYIASNSTNTTELYNASSQGLCTSKLITFSSPYHSYSVTGGTIEESGDNYVILTITSSDGVLSGKKYEETTSVFVKKNPNLNVEDLENIKKVTDATLIGANNGETIANNIYNYYANTSTITTSIVDLKEHVGDTITVDNSWRDDKTGIITSMTFNASSGFVPEIEIH